MDIVERLNNIALGDHERGCQGREYVCTCEYDQASWSAGAEAATLITSLRARCASLEAERDGLKSKMLDLVLALEAVRDDVHLPPHVVGRVCAALAAYRKDASHE